MYNFTANSLRNIKRDLNVVEHGGRYIDGFIRLVDYLRNEETLFIYVIKYPNVKSSDILTYPDTDPLFVFTFRSNREMLKRSKLTHCMSDATHNFCKWGNNLKLVTVMTITD